METSNKLSSKGCPAAQPPGPGGPLPRGWQSRRLLGTPPGLRARCLKRKRPHCPWPPGLQGPRPPAGCHSQVLAKPSKMPQWYSWRLDNLHLGKALPKNLLASYKRTYHKRCSQNFRAWKYFVQWFHTWPIQKPLIVIHIGKREILCVMRLFGSLSFWKWCLHFGTRAHRNLHHCTSTWSIDGTSCKASWWACKTSNESNPGAAMAICRCDTLESAWSALRTATFQIMNGKFWFFKINKK